MPNYVLYLRDAVEVMILTYIQPYQCRYVHKARSHAHKKAHFYTWAQQLLTFQIALEPKRTCRFRLCISTLRLSLNLNPLILPPPNILQRPLEMLLRTLQPGRILRRVEVAMYQLNQPIQILRRYSIVFLVKVVDVAVQDLHEELDGDGGVHAGVGDAEGTLEAFEDALAVAVGLVGVLVRKWWGVFGGKTNLFAAFGLFALFDCPPEMAC